MKRLFGTDGVRGVANLDLTPELALKIAKAGGYCLGAGSDKPYFLLGKDTRYSGDMIEGAVIAGLCSVGVDVINVGILPTPGIAYLTRKLGANAGVVISASHNPIEDNGIKFFDSNGYKLSDEKEEEIEQLLDKELPRPSGIKLGKVRSLSNASELYADYLISQVGTSLKGLKVVLDCAYGAAYKVAPLVYRALDADVVSINDAPLGEKINANCGATHPEVIKEEVKKYPGSIGISFDGDSDRVILVDEEGNIFDGDNILAIWGIELWKKKRLTNNIVVGTILSNMGLEKALSRYSIKLVRAQVGDRYVLEEMLKNNAVIGGEPSGHIIYLPGVTTGDGIYTSLMMIKILKENDTSLSSFKDIITRYPQISKNIKVKDKYGILTNSYMKSLIEDVENTLKDRGRCIIRPSGTEDCLRIMLEGEDREFIERLIEEITDKVREIDNAYF